MEGVVVVVAVVVDDEERVMSFPLASSRLDLQPQLGQEKFVDVDNFLETCVDQKREAGTKVIVFTCLARS